MIPNIDSPKYQGQRKLMVSKLKSLGINNKNILNALNSVPRHLFMDKTLIDYSYEDKAYPIKSNQTISQPFTVAIQTQLLNIKKNEKILEIIKESLSKSNDESFSITENLSYPLREARENFEKEYLTTQLKKFGGNISKTAKFVGMERSALHRKLKILGVKDLN